MAATDENNPSTQIAVGGKDDATVRDSSNSGSNISDDENVWDVDFSSDETPFFELSPTEQVKKVTILLLKVCVILGSLYAFICSLSFLATGFRLIAGKQAGEIFRNSEIFNNQVAAMLIGVLVTVLVQSSSTSTSIIITMVAADLFTVTQAIPLIMGANIGTSVTSTIVALAQSGEKETFQRAFAAATVHDMFNFLTVAVFLPLEMMTKYLYNFSKWLISLSPGLESGEKPPDMLKRLTKPFTSLCVKIDKKLISKIAKEDDPDKLAELEDTPMLEYLFDWGPDDLSDGAAGTIVLIAALIILCTALFLIVYTLKSILKGRIAVWLHRSVNGNIPDLKLGNVTIPMGWLTGYLSIAVGTLVTIAVQSSSITTSVLTPLVGVGVIKLERMYPTVLGANIGTCVTGVLAALAASSSKLYLTLQVSYVHLLFNISGIFLWYVIWPLRAIPINAAKALGRTTANYKWFALAYLFVLFFLLPLVFVGLAFAGTAAVVVFVVLFAIIGLSVLVINVLQARHPEWLPEKLRTWEWLPLYLRSLEPLDRVVCQPAGAYLTKACPCCATKPKTGKVAPLSSSTSKSANAHATVGLSA